MEKIVNTFKGDFEEINRNYLDTGVWKVKTIVPYFQSVASGQQYSFAEGDYGAYVVLERNT